MHTLCVFCGSSLGQDPQYAASSAAFGREIARRDIRMVYGGSDAGLMGITARSVLESGGSVTGIITRELYAATEHLDVSELVIRDTMHQRKHTMHECSDGFAALPGGIGTLEELLESFTWSQLGIHSKPVALLNAGGFFDPLLKLLDHLTVQGFLSPRQRSSLIVSRDPGRLLDKMLEASGS